MQADLNNENDKIQHYPSLPKFKAICEYIEYCDDTSKVNTKHNQQQQQFMQFKEEHEHGADATTGTAAEQTETAKEKPTSKASSSTTNSDGDNSNAQTAHVFAWHKMLAPPPKQMVVIDRMHSGARRFVVLDFGSPVLLTDVVIPPCDDLASLIIDLWCFDEEVDSVRLVATSDIGSKTLVLSDLNHPPICRYMRITIIGRIGMSSTKCKIPIGSFFGHALVLESDGYADPLLHYVKHPAQHVQAQVKALNSLYEDVHCRYSLASCKLMELLTPILNCELSNVAHMQAFIQKQRDEENNSSMDNSKIVTIYEVY